MKASIEYNQKHFKIDLSKAMDISITLQANDNNPVAWYLSKPSIEPVVIGDWVGQVKQGKSATNFNNILVNPHAHTTHTECLGHITREFYSLNDHLKEFFFYSQLVSVTPSFHHADDQVITLEQIQNLWQDKGQKAFIIRTLPNGIEKKGRKYSHTNPPYIDREVAQFLKLKGVDHLLVDLPSVDKEIDNGALLSHRAFWNVEDIDVLNSDARLSATITELIYVPDTIKDGFYFLNLQVAAISNDASLSRPVLFEIE